MEYIAEIGNNHNGDIVLAKNMVDAAIGSGADYVKFQIYNVDKFVEKNSIYFDDFSREALTSDEFFELKNYTEQQGGTFLATPFDNDSANLLSEMGIHTVKIASGDMNNWQLLRVIAKKGNRLLVSIGGASEEEVSETVGFLKSSGAEFAILHCIIEYPANITNLYLSQIPLLRCRYDCRVGYSDHSLGIEASLGAIALGAEIIEKHFTTDQRLPGGDNGMSILPMELERLVREGNNINLAIGEGRKVLGLDEKKMKSLIRREIFAGREIQRGSNLVDDDLLLLRPSAPGDGLGPDNYDRLLGCRVKCDIATGQLITLDLLDNGD
jgi:sialic acid synthase SpsE